MSKHVSSRRTILAGIAAAPVLAVPAVAAAVPALAAAPKPDPYSEAAVLARVEVVIDRLRNCVVCRGWEPDTGGCERVLSYYRRTVAEPEWDDVDEFYYTLSFFKENGQNLTWIFGGDPGGFIVEAAGHSTQAAKRIDPIFAAIEAHRAAEAEYVAACEADCDDEIANVAGERSHELLIALLDVTPTTTPGCMALLRHLDKYTHEYEQGYLFYEKNLPERSFGVLSRVAMALERAV